MKQMRTLRAAAALWPVLFILCAAEARWAQTAQRAPDALVINTEMVSLAVSVTDTQGRLFTGLERNAFTVFEDGVAQELSFFSVADGPASVGVVFDVSSSMSGARIARARQALAHFVATSHADDEYALVAFNDRPQLLLEGFSNEQTLLSRTAHLQPHGQTALYDAVALALARVQQGRYAKRALLVISDGEDNRSRLSFGKLRRLVQEAGVPVYGVVVSDFFARSDEVWMLDELASHSGGASYFPNDAEGLNDAFERIALQLRQQYSLGYLPTNFTADGKWRKLKVKIAPPPGAPKLIVRSRAGYYANPERAARERSVAAWEND